MSSLLLRRTSSALRFMQPVMVRSRAMSTNGVRGFDERERAAETLWFNKQEEKALRNLLTKMKAQADQLDSVQRSAVEAAESKALKGILPNLTSEEVKKLMDWKHKCFI